MSITLAILGLAFLVLVHEAGHFFTARAVGMRPRRFYVGFPPAIVKFRRNGIEYGLGAIPLGGYVKIPGMHRPAPSDLDGYFARALAERPELFGTIEHVKRPLADADMDRARVELEPLRAALAAVQLSEQARRSSQRGVRELEDALGAEAYWRQRTWKRVAVIFAGPGTNLLVAVVLLAVVFMIGVPVESSRTVESVLSGSAAEKTGLRAGDKIIGVNGIRTESFDDVSQAMRGSGGKEVEVLVIRDGEPVQLPPGRPELRNDRYVFGFQPALRYEHYGLIEATELSIRETWEVTKAIGASLRRLVTGEGREDVASPVGIVQGSSQAFEVDYRYYLQILALISLSLALLNLLPLLPLDGGHIVFSLIEGLRGRAVGREVYERVSAIGIAMVLLLFFVGLSNDVGRLNDG